MGVDQLQLNFDSSAGLVLSIVLGIVMFGVALDLRTDDFRRVRQYPSGVLAGVLGQFFLLPALTFGLIQFLQQVAGDWFTPSLALGMLLVAACPGGNMSNFFSHLARGSTGLSVTLTAISSIVAVVMTPLNFVLWAMLDGDTAQALQALLQQMPFGTEPTTSQATQLDMQHAALWPTVWFLLKQMFVTVLLVLAIPLAVGMIVGRRRPELASRARRPFKIGSLLVFSSFVVVALLANWSNFVDYIGVIFGIVLLHNALALLTGRLLGKSFGLPAPEVRSLTIEIGIQNSGLGLLLVFTLFNGLGGMALIAAWWGIWHLIAGASLGLWWARDWLGLRAHQKPAN